MTCKDTQINLALASPWLRGFPDRFDAPVSCWTEVREADFPRDGALATLARAECLVGDLRRRMLHMFNDLEYETDTLAKEYHRDGAGPLPVDYFPGDDPTRAPENRWRRHAHRLFGNWINEIY